MIVSISSNKFLNIKVSEFMKEFKNLIGTPYVYGGSYTSDYCKSTSCTVHSKDKKYKGVDCSGMVYHVLGKYNYNKFGRSTSQMQSSKGYGQWVSQKSELKIGDLIFFNGHVGVVSRFEKDRTYMIHAPKCGKTVCEQDIGYRKDFTKGLRILKENMESVATLDNKKEGVDKMKFAINDGHTLSGTTGSGAVGILNESNENRKVGKIVRQLLKELGHTVVDCTIDRSSSYLKEAVAKANAQAVDLAVSIHFNASDGRAKGTEVLVYNDHATPNKYAKQVASEIAKLGFSNRGIKLRPDLYWLKATTSKAILIECCFVDNKEDTNRYNAQKMAEAIVLGLVGELPAKATPSTFQVGSYHKDVVTTDNLNVRSSREVVNSPSNVIGTFAKGEKVNIWYIDYNKDKTALWGSCSINGKTGYVSMNYCKAL